MNSSSSWIAAAAVVLIGSISGYSVARADDSAVIEQRQAQMKSQSKDLGAVKAFLEDKGDLAAAQAAGADLVGKLPKIPDLFPAGSGMDAYPGKSYAKPVIWTEHDKFVAADKNAVAATEALNAALKSGDKAAIATAFGNMARNFWGTASDPPGACGGCHGTFMQKRPS